MRTLALVLVLASSSACGKQAAEAPPPGTSVPGSGGSATAAAPAHPMHKDPEKARQLIAAGATVLDVRTPAEYGDGHVDKATNIPVGDFAARIAEVDKLVGGDKTKPVVVYCAAGKRAHAAQLQLEAAGYTNVVNGGGWDDLH